MACHSSEVSERVAQDVVSIQRGSGNRRLEFEIDDETFELLERLKQIESHKGKQSMNKILKSLLREYLYRHDPAQKGQREGAKMS